MDKGVWRGADGTRGGIPVSVSLSGLLPIGQPLGDVEDGSDEAMRDKSSGSKSFQVFFGLELRPWLGTNNQDEAVLSDDPLALFSIAKPQQGTEGTAEIDSEADDLHAATPPEPTPPIEVGESLLQTIPATTTAPDADLKTVCEVVELSELKPTPTQKEPVTA